MKTAADRVLAESWIGEKISSDVTDAAIEKAYKTFVADTASREQVTAAHILVATEDEAKDDYCFACRRSGFCRTGEEKNQQDQVGQMAAHSENLVVDKWSQPLKMPLLH